jgi:uncharacterized Zn-binding protein involved in type VI secretion
VSRQAGGALQLAGVGHRITHEDDIPEAVEMAERTLRHAERTLERGRHPDAKLALAIGAALAIFKKLSDGNKKSDSDDAEEPCPDPCGAIEEGSENTFIGKQRRAVALAGDKGPPCEDHEDDPIREGSANVWINGKRAARRTDETECGAQIGEGDNTVWLGAETAKDGERKIADKLEQFLQSMIGDLVSGKRMNNALAAQHLADAISGSKKSPSSAGGGAAGAALGDQLVSGKLPH